MRLALQWRVGSVGDYSGGAVRSAIEVLQSRASSRQEDLKFLPYIRCVVRVVAETIAARGRGVKSGRATWFLREELAVIVQESATAPWFAFWIGPSTKSQQEVDKPAR